MLSRKLTGSIVAAVAAIAIGAGSYGIVSATSSSASTTASSSTPSTPASGSASGGGSNARSGPAAGGSSGTVSSVSSSGFTLTTSSGEKVTIKETSSTTYEKGTSPATASAVTSGEPVLVLGTTDSTTITAIQVIVQLPSSSASNPGGQVIPYTKGEQGSSEQVGQIPADYKQGSGTIVSGTTATKATEAALAAYPGGVVDRVVALGNGDYEVHYIGVNWPHHIFVNQDFQVIGADD
jgi:membrane-bound inhibitor of C-type lysozyme